MKKFTSSLLFICLYFTSLQAQEIDFQSLHQEQYDAEMQALVVDTEVWRVDSTYCWANDTSTGMEVPFVRSYNLEFSEYSGRILHEERQEYIDNTWVNSLRKEYIYDVNDYIKEVIDETWISQDNIWKFTDKTLFDYNPLANNSNDITSQTWENNTWNNRSLTINSFYPVHYAVEESENYLWENNAWVLDNKFYYIVNFNTILTEDILFQKRNESGVLTSISRTHIDYDEMGNDTLTTYELNNGDWYPTSRIQKEIENGKDVLRTEQVYNADEMTWTNTNQTQTSYTPTGKPDIITSLSWNAQENAFIPSYHTTHGYDAADNIVEFASSFYQDGTWVFNSRCQLFRSLHEVVIDPHAEETATTDLILQDCKIANPLQAGSSFSCTDWDIKGKGSIAIYDLSGRMIASQTVENQNGIEVKSGLNSGFYTLVLRDERGMVWRKKVVVE